MPHFVPANGFTQQIEEFAKQLGYLTDDVVLVDDDEASPLRSVSYLVALRDPQTQVTTTFDYREEFQKISRGWLRTEYVYELRISQPNSARLHARRAHHEHEPRGTHQHADAPGCPDAVHYRDVERLLQATHELLVQQYTRGAPVTCAGLVPLSAP